MHLFIYILLFTCHLMLDIRMLDREVATAWKSGWNNISILNQKKFSMGADSPRFGLAKGGGGVKEKVFRIPMRVA